MKLTTKSEYSLLLLLALVRTKDSNSVDLATLCEATQVPLKYAEQLFAVLKKANVVKSRRGYGGGYTLARKPADITLAEIIRMMDGPLAATEAASIHFHSATPIAREQKLLGLFREIRDYVSNRLENISLEDLA